MPICCFFFNDTATTEIYTLSLHDALPIFVRGAAKHLEDHPKVALRCEVRDPGAAELAAEDHVVLTLRSEEHTSELQSRQYLVCRLLLEKKKNQRYDLILK